MPTRIYLSLTAAVQFCDFVKHSLIVIFSMIGASTGGNFSIVVSLFTFLAPVHETHPFLSGSNCITGGMLDTSWRNNHKLSDWCAITITSTLLVNKRYFCACVASFWQSNFPCDTDLAIVPGTLTGEYVSFPIPSNASIPSYIRPNVLWVVPHPDRVSLSRSKLSKQKCMTILYHVTMCSDIGPQCSFSLR